jgi:hypothetical protein
MKNAILLGIFQKRQQWNGVICVNLLKQKAETKRRNTNERTKKSVDVEQG